MSPTTIGTIRGELEAAERAYQGAEVEQQDEQVVSKLDTLPEKDYGVADCPCCQTQLRAVKRRGELVLEAL